MMTKKSQQWWNKGGKGFILLHYYCAIMRPWYLAYIGRKRIQYRHYHVRIERSIYFSLNDEWLHIIDSQTFSFCWCWYIENWLLQTISVSKRIDSWTLSEWKWGWVSRQPIQRIGQISEVIFASIFLYRDLFTILIVYKWSNGKGHIDISTFLNEFGSQKGY